jgi:Flp pilus assembly protein TadG
MRRSSRWTEADASSGAGGGLAGDERGSAALEFITVGLLMLVPLVYLVVAAGAVQNHALGAEAAARFTARAIAQSEGDGAAAGAADATLAAISAEYGMDRGRTAVRIECVPAGDGCPAAGSTVLVTVRSEVSLPLVPPILGLDRIATVPVEATSGQKVSRFWSAG